MASEILTLETTKSFATKTALQALVHIQRKHCILSLYFEWKALLLCQGDYQEAVASLIVDSLNL